MTKDEVRSELETMKNRARGASGNAADICNLLRSQCNLIAWLVIQELERPATVAKYVAPSVAEKQKNREAVA